MGQKSIALMVGTVLLATGSRADDVYGGYEIGAPTEGLVTLSAIEGDIAWSRYGLTSLQQGLKVNAVSINRGNCEVDDALTADGNQFQFPFSLNYGDVLTIHMMCQPIEIIVQTNLGWQQFAKH